MQSKSYYFRKQLKSIYYRNVIEIEFLSNQVLKEYGTIRVDKDKTVDFFGQEIIAIDKS